jgi:hypothetical protein
MKISSDFFPGPPLFRDSSVWICILGLALANLFTDCMWVNIAVLGVFLINFIIQVVKQFRRSMK